MADLFRPDGSGPESEAERERHAAALLGPYATYDWLFFSPGGRELFEDGAYRTLAERLRKKARRGRVVGPAVLLAVAMFGWTMGDPTGASILILVVPLAFLGAERTRRSAERALDVLDGHVPYPDVVARLAATTGAVEMEIRPGGQWLTYVALGEAEENDSAIQWRSERLTAEALADRLRAHPDWAEGDTRVFWRRWPGLTPVGWGAGALLTLGAAGGAVLSAAAFAGDTGPVGNIAATEAGLVSLVGLLFLLEMVDRQWNPRSYWHEMGLVDWRLRPGLPWGIGWGKVVVLAAVLFLGTLMMLG